MSKNKLLGLIFSTMLLLFLFQINVTAGTYQYERGDSLEDYIEKSNETLANDSEDPQHGVKVYSLDILSQTTLEDGKVLVRVKSVYDSFYHDYTGDTSDFDLYYFVNNKLSSGKIEPANSINNMEGEGEHTGGLGGVYENRYGQFEDTYELIFDPAYNDESEITVTLAMCRTGYMPMYFKAFGSTKEFTINFNEVYGTENDANGTSDDGSNTDFDGDFLESRMIITDQGYVDGLYPYIDFIIRDTQYWESVPKIGDGDIVGIYVIRDLGDYDEIEHSTFEPLDGFSIQYNGTEVIGSKEIEGQEVYKYELSYRFIDYSVQTAASAHTYMLNAHWRIDLFVVGTEAPIHFGRGDATTSDMSPILVTGLLSFLMALIASGMSSTPTSKKKKVPTTDSEILDAWNKGTPQNKDPKVITDQDVIEYEKATSVDPPEDSAVNVTTPSPEIPVTSTDVSLDVKDEDESTDGKQLRLNTYCSSKALVIGDSKEIDVYARVVGDQDVKLAASLTPSLTLELQYIYPDGLGGDYVTIIDKGVQNGEKVFGISFTYRKGSRHYGADEGLTFPRDLQLLMSTSKDVSPSEKSIKINISNQATLHVDPKSVAMPMGSNEHYPVHAWVNSAERDEWVFTTEIEDRLEVAIDSVQVTAKTDKEVELNLTAANLDVGAGRQISSKLIIKASNARTNETIQTKLLVTSAKEGLICVSELPLKVIGDGETEAELKFTAVTHDGLQGVKSDDELLSQIKISHALFFNDKLSERAFQAGGLMFEAVGYDDNDQSITKNGHLSTYTVKVKTVRMVPADGEIFYAETTAKSFKGTSEYVVPLSFELDLTTMAPKSDLWREELSECRKAIKFLPPADQQKMLDVVNSKALYLGAGALYELRKRMLKLAITKWQVEGYNALERGDDEWTIAIANCFDITDFVCRMGFNVVANIIVQTYLASCGPKVKVAGAALTSALSDALYSGMQYAVNSVVYSVSEDHQQAFEEWKNEKFEDFLVDFIQNAGAEVLDPERAAQLLKGSPHVMVAGYVVLFFYYYGTNVEVKKQSHNEAAYNAAMTVSFNALMTYVGPIAAKRVSKTMKSLGKNLDEAIEHITSKKQIGQITADSLEDASKHIRGLEDAIDSNNPSALLDNVMNIKSNKNALLEINRAKDLKLIQAIEDTYNKQVKKPFLNKIKEQVLDKYKGKSAYKNLVIEMDSISNKTNVTKAANDIDYSVTIKYDLEVKNMSTGEVQIKTIKRQLSAKEIDTYGQKSIKEVIPEKYRKGLSSKEVMHKFDISAMGRDAAGGYGIDVHSATTLKSDKKSYITNGLNINDPDGFARGCRYKVEEFFDGKSNVEGWRQFTKQYDNQLQPLRDICKARGKKVNDIPAILKDTKKIMDGVIKNGNDLESAVKKLSEKGYSMDEVMNKFEDYIGMYSKEAPKTSLIVSSNVLKFN